MLIFFDQEPGVFSCTLRDIDDFGIGLRLNDPDVIEETFKITLDNFKSVQSCRMMWSRGRYIGATFSTDSSADYNAGFVAIVGLRGHRSRGQTPQQVSGRLRSKTDVIAKVTVRRQATLSSAWFHRRAHTFDDENF